MIRLAATLLSAILVLSGCASTSSTPSQPALGIQTRQLPLEANTAVILVSIDGFRNDSLQRGLTPALQQLADGGVRAEFMRPSYPSITFPNHYMLVTGLRPDRHGVIANFMTDPNIPGVRFSMFDPSTTGDARWWDDGKPLWSSVHEYGGHAAAMFWVGSEAPVHGARPEFWRPFDIKVSSTERVDQVLQWLALPPARRPHFITLYFDLVDTMGHLHGPDSVELNAALVEVDAAIARLVAGIKGQGLTRNINLVIGSDHGMANTGPEKEVFLDDLVDVGQLDFNWTGAYAAFDALPGGESQAIKLLGRHEQMECMTREQIPTRFAYGNHRRVPAYICIAEHGWQITTRDAMQRKGHRLRG